MKILLTNDDGIKAPGLKAMATAVEGNHECVTVAPASEKSACGHSISLGQKLVIKELTSRRFSVYGTPADCVKFALSELGFKPDLLISGINPGPNTGVSVYYSGTISAAREGLINQLPGIAVSIACRGARPYAPTNFSYAASFTSWVLRGYEKGDFPRHIFLNINVPDLPEAKIRGIRIARQASSHFVEEFIKEAAMDHQRVYRLAGEIQVFDPDGTSDDEVLSEGFISITPLKLDLTDYGAMPVLEQWFKETWGKPKNI